MRVCPVDEFLDLGRNNVNADYVRIWHLFPEFWIFNVEICVDEIVSIFMEIEAPESVNRADGEFADLCFDSAETGMLITGLDAGSYELVGQLFLDRILVLEK